MVFTIPKRFLVEVYGRADMQFKDAVFICVLSLLLRPMQRKVELVVSLTGTDLDFYRLNFGVIARDETYIDNVSTAKILLRCVFFVHITFGLNNSFA